MICPTCSLWFCTDDHDLDGRNAAIRNREAVAKWRAKHPDKNRAKVAKWQRENKDKLSARQRRYHERKRLVRERHQEAGNEADRADLAL